ncbi:MAG: SusD/RagB family nutrient-binding outer membrane lipoprotein [Mucilaginibacter sp.]
MKKIYIYLLATVLLTGANSCDKGFKELNVNPNSPTTLDPVYLFSNAQLNSAVITYYYQMQIVQQIIHPYTGNSSGANENVMNDSNSNVDFNSFYSGPVVYLADVINQTKGSATRSNLYNMARIWRAYVFMFLVDTYGDVPYTQAGLAASQSVNLPVYDHQQAIYTDILNELSTATPALDATKQIETSDLFYQGNITEWKKLGYSLLLRAAMRLTKSDPATAQKYALIAANGGVMTTNADDAYVQFNSTFNSPTGGWLQSTEKANVYVAKPFVDYLQSTNDPRLAVIAVKYAIPSNALGSTGAEDTTPADQIGMPFGYDQTNINTAPGFPGTVGASFKYSQINRRTLGKITSPEFFVTAAQTQLLLAEAAQRGWITTGSAAAYYNAGVVAAMDQMAIYDATATISTANEASYLASNPFNPATALQQINTQYWVASFLNGGEAFANFRRSGYPLLTPNPYPGADASVKGGFIHRLPYPVREQSVNAANYAAAVADMGPDNLATHVFWDK